MKTHRLDVSKTPMAAAVDWLLARAGSEALDLSGTLIATPGARAGRVLNTMLAQACQARGLVLSPPNVVTAGRLAEALAPAPRPAGELHRMLAWRAVLGAAPASELAAVLPSSESPAQWAQEISQAADELSRGGLRCADAARAEIPPLEDPKRWEALATLQDRYESLLDQAGMADPMLSAIDAGEAIARGLDAVVLLGCMDLPGLAREMLHRVPCPVHALVMLGEGLDADGVVDEGYWRDAEIDIDPGSVFVTGDAGEQGALAVRAAADMDTSAIGTADEALAGAVRRAAADHGLSVHVAWGGAASASGPGRLLADLALLLRERSFSALSRVLRCPMVVASLSREYAGFSELPRALDDYQAATLPTRAFAKLPEGSDRVAQPRRIVTHARRRLRAMTSELRGKRRPLRDWAPALERSLSAMLAPAEDLLGPASLEAIAAIGEQLRVLAWLPEALDARPVAAHEAIVLVLGELQRQGAAGEPGGEDLDLLGWLELPLDPSPAMVVMGAHHSSLPAASTPGPLLTEALRRSLGLAGEPRKLARDAANLASLLGGQRRVRFVLGSVNTRGESLLPSTLLLRGRGDGPARVLSRTRARFATLPASEAPDRCGYRVGVMRGSRPVVSMSVTSFRTFLESPYQFYLRYVLGLREVSPQGRIATLEANTFGTLLHEALHRFGADEQTRGVTDEGEIRRLMHAALWESAERLAGKTPTAMTRARIDAAERRLSALASEESQRRSAGWRTLEVEWTPQEQPPLGDTGVTLRGAIDRIDWHEQTGTLALLDYKVSEDPRQPGGSHRKRDGTWRDLQLPLYEVLARPIAAERGVERMPIMGYVALAGTGTKVIESGWTEEDVADAHACAMDVATRVCSGLEAMAGVGSPKYGGPHARLAGIGMLLDKEHHVQSEGATP